MTPQLHDTSNQATAVYGTSSLSPSFFCPGSSEWKSEAAATSMRNTIHPLISFSLRNGYADLFSPLHLRGAGSPSGYLGWCASGSSRIQELPPSSVPTVHASSLGSPSRLSPASAASSPEWSPPGGSLD